MKSLDFEVVDTLRSDPNRRVLHVIAQRKRARLEDLVKGDLAREQAMAAIESLKNAKLIKESPSPLPDLATFFVTAAGIQADREL